MGSAFHQLSPRLCVIFTPTSPMAIRLWETFTFIFFVSHSVIKMRSEINVVKIQFAISFTFDQHHTFLITIRKKSVSQLYTCTIVYEESPVGTK